MKVKTLGKIYFLALIHLDRLLFERYFIVLLMSTLSIRLTLRQVGWSIYNSSIVAKIKDVAYPHIYTLLYDSLAASSADKLSPDYTTR